MKVAWRLDKAQIGQHVPDVREGVVGGSEVEGGEMYMQLLFCMQLSGTDMECEVKPLSNEEEEPVAREEEPEDEAHLKKPSDSDDDDEEPPPPYTPHDPQEEKSDDSKKSRGASSEGCEETGAVGEDAIPSDQLSDLPSELHSRDDPSDNLLNDHPKLIPEPSLGFQVQPVPVPPDNPVQQSEDWEMDAAGDIEKPASNSSDSESGDSSRPATTSPLSPADLSRISSPEKGRTLSEMTRITPEDEARVVETQLTSSIPGADSRTASSDSNTTLVNSQSQQSQSELTVTESSTTVTTSSSEQSNSQPVASSPLSSSGGGGGGGLKSFLKGKGKGKKHDKGSKSGGSESKSKEKVHKKGKSKDLDNHAPNSSSQATGKKGKEKVKEPAPVERNSTPQSPQGNLTTLKASGYHAQLGNSQESFVDGLSPELSDYGDHSNEADYLPREARILRAGYVVGLSIDLDDKNCVVVKSVSSGGAVGRDGRIRVGDRIEAINGKALAGVNLSRAKAILKRASKSDEICITYSPAPGPPLTTNQDKQLPQKSASVSEKVVPPPKQHNPYYSIATMASPLRDQQESAVPGPQASGGMQMLPPQVQGLPPHMMQQTGSWQMEGVSPYHSSGMHHIPPQLQGFYSQHPREGNPPPPYLFPSVRPAPAMMAGQPAYGPMVVGTQAPPPQMTWSLSQQQIAAPQGNSQLQSDT